MRSDRSRGREGGPKRHAWRARKRKLKQSPVRVIARSKNRKLGDVAATYTSQASCPKSCPFFKKGCYAEAPPMGWTVTRRLNASRVRDPDRVAALEADAVDALPADRDLRLHVLGDCPTEQAAETVSAAAARYVARGVVADFRRGARKPGVWTYTHAWREVPRSAWGKVSVLASCEAPSQARSAMRQGYAAALVVAEFESERTYELDGVKVVPCPNQTRGVKCVDCRLCLDDTRLRKGKLVIGFVAHGQRRKTIAATLSRISLAVV